MIDSLPFLKIIHVCVWIKKKLVRKSGEEQRIDLIRLGKRKESLSPLLPLLLQYPPMSGLERPLHHLTYAHYAQHTTLLASSARGDGGGANLSALRKTRLASQKAILISC